MFAQPRVWGDTEAGSCDPTPGAGISLHHDFHIPLSPQPGSRHTQLANPAPPQPCAFGLALQLPGGGHIPSTAVPGAGQSPRAVRQRDLSVCLAWCCCSLPAVSRCISRAQQRFPPEHGQHIPWQRGDTGGAAGALCPWGFTHGNRDSTEPLMLLLPPPAARGSGVAQESGTVLRALGCRDTRWEGGLHLGSCQPPAECSTEHVGSARSSKPDKAWERGDF